VRVHALPVPQQLVRGDYSNDPAVREAYQKWVQQMWLEKDAQIEAILNESRTK
jgi:hypothetical protein